MTEDSEQGDPKKLQCKTKKERNKQKILCLELPWMNVPEVLLGSSVLEQPTGVSGGETSRGGMMGLGYEINPIRWSWMV